MNGDKYFRVVDVEFDVAKSDSVSGFKKKFFIKGWKGINDADGKNWCYDQAMKNDGKECSSYDQKFTCVEPTVRVSKTFFILSDFISEVQRVLN